MSTLLLPLALLGATWLVDASCWREYRTRLAPSRDDRSTASLITLATAVAVVTGLMLGLINPQALRLSPNWVSVGTVLALAGMALRGWAIARLGARFTFTLQRRDGQAIETHGPYRWVRHPGYLGSQLSLLGIGLSCGNALAAVAMLAPVLAAHLWRIAIEERMLSRTGGEQWREYRERTWRLVPWLY